MAREAALWEWMHRHGRTVPDLVMERVENSLMRGMGDVNALYAGREWWAELKGADRPVRPTTPVRLPHFTDYQVHWLTKRWIAGGLTWLYVRVGKGHRISRYILCPGEPGLLVRAQVGMTEAEMIEASPLPPGHGFADALHRFSHRLDYPHR